MGYLEGLLSHDRIYDAYYNIIHSSNPVPAHVLLFASQQVQSPHRFRAPQHRALTLTRSCAPSVLHSCCG